jgi:hypothetical protein
MKPLLWLPDKFTKHNDWWSVWEWLGPWPSTCDVKMFKHSKSETFDFMNIKMFTEKESALVVPEHLKHDIAKWKLEKSIILDDPWTEELEAVLKSKNVDKWYNELFNTLEPYTATQALMNEHVKKSKGYGMSFVETYYGEEYKNAIQHLTDNDAWFFAEKPEDYTWTKPKVKPYWRHRIVINDDGMQEIGFSTNTRRDLPSLCSSSVRTVTIEALLAQFFPCTTQPVTIYRSIPVCLSSLTSTVQPLPTSCVGASPS